MERFQGAALVAATITVGIMTGVFHATFAVRERFDETKWVRWNLVRAVATTVAFGCLTWALVLHGRMTQGGA